MRLRLGRHYILMAAEIDCCDPPAPVGPQLPEAPQPAFLELKTYKCVYQHWNTWRGLERILQLIQRWEKLGSTYVLWVYCAAVGS